MKAAACVAIVALTIGLVSAQAPNATATPAAIPAGALPGALPATAAPAVNATGTSPAPGPPSPSPSNSPSPSPSPAPAETVPAATTTEEPVAANATANTTTTEEPAAANVSANTTIPVAPAAANATKATSITNPQISAFYPSPLFAIQSTPELKQLANLGAGSEVAKLLNNKTLVATIFAPNNEAVTRAVQYVANATGVDAKSLAEQGVVEQLLTYHVTEGAAILEGKFKNNQTFTMLDGNKTTILVEEPVPGARKLLQAGNATYYIVSDSNQKIRLTTPANIQGGKSMIHVIDGVLVPQALLDRYNITDTAQLPGAAPTNATIQAAPAPTVTSREVTTTPTTSLTTPGHNSAATAAAALLAVPALLAAVML